MKFLIVEDDATSRLLLEELLKKYGSCLSVENGEQAEAVFSQALRNGEPFDLVCIDIRLSGISGQELLRRIRTIESQQKKDPLSKRAKIIMTTVLGDLKNVAEAFANMCDAYIVKPVDQKKLEEKMRTLGLLR